MTSKTLPFHADTVGSYLRSQPLKKPVQNLQQVNFLVNN